MCPHCRQNAPIVYRGVMAYCSVCHAPRPPFSGRALNFAGQPSKIGGGVAKAFGWLVLIGGLVIALCTLAFFQMLAPSMSLGYAFATPIALLSTVIGSLMLFGGKKLQTSGHQTQRTAQFEAAYALASHRGGAVTPVDVAHSLGVSFAEADQVLTEMTKQFPDYVSLEVDDNGALFYKLAGVGKPPSAEFGIKYRVEPDGRVRIFDELAAAAREQAEYEAQQHDQARRGR
jgi:hypothetical protein